MGKTRSVVGLCCVLLVPLSGTSAEAQEPAAPAGGGAGELSDFNGDGFGDLAIGVPSEGGDAVAKGGVNVIYGSATGLSATAFPDQFWSQDSPGIEGTAEVFDMFGEVLTTGNFNGDSYADLAISATGEDFFANDDGAVHVIYGSAVGLSASATRSDQIWSQDTTNVAGTAEDNDGFGDALNAGDFNGDGFDDLAVGLPFEEVSGVERAGGVNVIYGSATGLSATTVPDQFWSQGTTNVDGTIAAFDDFGWALASGNFGGNGTYDDLAIGARGDLVNGIAGGAVNVIYGSAGGLSATATPDQLWSQNSTGMTGGAEAGDEFGAALTAGDFGGSTHDDLAIGVPDEDIDGADGGAVAVIYGSTGGLTATGDQLWSQNSTGIAGTTEDGDQFGAALASGDFGGSSHADLAIGTPREDVDVTDDGSVSVIYGNTSGLTSSASQLWSQSSANVEEETTAADTFGQAVAAGNFGGSVHDDLAIGVPGEDTIQSPNCGGANVIYGSAFRLSATATPDQFWWQASADVEESCGESNTFGSSLAA